MCCSPPLPFARRSAVQQPVRTRGGLVSGVAGKNPSITAFKGIPFAAPPVGNLRWAAPKPPAPWTGVRKAGKFSASCIQTLADAGRDPWTPEFMTHGEISEDCLYLNVFTAARSAGEKRPVFVYIYGGGFNEGSGPFPFTTAKDWPARASWWSRSITASALWGSSITPS